MCHHRKGKRTRTRDGSRHGWTRCSRSRPRSRTRGTAIVDEVSLILCPRGKHARWVGHWLELLREHPAFAGARIGIAHLGDTGRESHDVHVEAVMRISLDGGEQAMRAILERITR